MMNQHVMDKDRDPAEQEARWQKHVLITLLIAVVLVLLLNSVLVFAKAHGFFDLLSDRTPPAPAWPIGWP
jgi:hypothetical protein